VTVTANEILLWSTSRLEGTLPEPRFKVARNEPRAMQDLGRMLESIVKRRWGGKPRPPGSQEIVVMAEGKVTMQTIAEVLATVRTTPDGKTPLFPDIMLSSGFE
jgi:hypothetical protein